MLKQKKKKIYFIKKTILLIFISIITFSLFFNELGLIKWYQLKTKRNKINADIDALLLKENKLNKEMYLLENDDNYIKEIARKKFYMVNSGEKIFRVIDKRKIKN
tara:strand:- start:372 stop:686 length:315 start_codon:yes stop_codon:yes gene_type:complete